MGLNSQQKIEKDKTMTAEDKDWGTDRGVILLSYHLNILHYRSSGLKAGQIARLSAHLHSSVHLVHTYTHPCSFHSRKCINAIVMSPSNADIGIWSDGRHVILHVDKIRSGS